MKNRNLDLIIAILALVLSLICMAYKFINYIYTETYAEQIEPVTIIMQTFPDNKGVTQPTVTPTPMPTEEPRQSMSLPKTEKGSFKAIEYMESITLKDSKQWYLKQLYTIDENGFCRIGEYYAVAMGTYYAKYIGQTFTIELESRTIEVIIGDVKNDKDTVNKMYCKTNGSIIEFIVKKGTITHEHLQELMYGNVKGIYHND